jgi:hypothetical protein
MVVGKVSCLNCLHNSYAYVSKGSNEVNCENGRNFLSAKALSILVLMESRLNSKEVY